MKKLLACCAASVALYLIVFGGLVDRPLSLGILRLEMAQKTVRLAAMPSPKIVILAGSNGPYSHSCAVIGAMLNLPCENAGIAVGIGLDEIFARDAPFLHRGDILYMPMELDQYTATAGQYRASADGSFLLRHDRALLAKLPAGRILGAMFCCNLADFLESLAEMPLEGAGAIAPTSVLTSQYNAEGDRIDNALADADPELLNHPARLEPAPAQIAQGYGAALVARFVARESAKGVIVIGGLPTDFATARVSAAEAGAIAAIYTTNGGVFAVLPNESLYPKADFFNSEDHLARPCQFLHSIAVAALLGGRLKQRVRDPLPGMMTLAAICPSADYAINAARWPAMRSQASASSSSNNSVSLRIIVPPSSSASTIVTARR